MRARCYHVRHPHYANYGARGITVCAQWLGGNGFGTFLADMGERPSLAHSLDRIDNNGSYAPDNCRWATHEQQCNNTRINRYFEFRGDRLTIAQFARRVGISEELATWRFNNGWSPEDAARPPRNRTRYVVTFRGETISAYSFAKRLGMSHEAMLYRLKSGWSPERIAATPVRVR